jgi:hypothetical protein
MKRAKIVMSNRLQHLSRRARSAIVSIAILAVWSTSGASPGLAQQSASPTFPSAAEASERLFQAVQRNDAAAVANILGGPSELASSGDAAQDKIDRELFAHKYQEMHRVGREADGSAALYIGAENWPFPIPLVEKTGAWRFDPEAGMKEVMFRRIGENELTAIATCHEFVAAAKHYRAEPNTANLTDISPASLAARAVSGSTGGDPVLFDGYYFRVLAARPKSGGGFALIAYPAEYRSSGVMTFIVMDNDVVYEKDLGANTPALASAIGGFHKDGTWHAAE